MAEIALPSAISLVRSIAGAHGEGNLDKLARAGMRESDAMTTSPLPNDHGADNLDETGGTSEETSLTVKLLGADWIVENAVGKSIGSAGDRETAIDLAKQAATSEKASTIAVLSADGTVESTVEV